jgi:hypothetical protein
MIIASENKLLGRTNEGTRIEKQAEPILLTKPLMGLMGD